MELLSLPKEDSKSATICGYPHTSKKKKIPEAKSHHTFHSRPTHCISKRPIGALRKHLKLAI